jgi:hypothetical protein
MLADFDGDIRRLLASGTAPVAPTVSGSEPQV